MKKFIGCSVCVLMLGNSMVAYAQDASLEERVSELERKVEILMKNSDLEADFDADSKSESSFEEDLGYKVDETIPTSIDEGLEYLPYKMGTAVNSIKVANARYNDTHLFIDFEIIARTLDYSLVDKLDKNAYFIITQPYNQDVKENNSSYSEYLNYQLNQYPEELVGDLPMLNTNMKIEDGSNFVTIAYRLSLPPEKGSKVFLTFDSNQVLEITLD